MKDIAKGISQSEPTCRDVDHLLKRLNQIIVLTECGGPQQEIAELVGRLAWNAVQPASSPISQADEDKIWVVEWTARGNEL